MHFGTVSDWDISASGVLPIMIQSTKKKNETTLSDTSKRAGVRQYLSALRAPRTPHTGSISVGHFPRNLNVPIITNKKQYFFIKSM
jgi:hypothetical protein